MSKQEDSSGEYHVKVQGYEFYYVSTDEAENESDAIREAYERAETGHLMIDEITVEEEYDCE